MRPSSGIRIIFLIRTHRWLWTESRRSASACPSIQEPIVILVYGGQRLVIDGRRRVTKWIKQNDHTPRRALIITSKTV
jgi:hypothetical protein